MSIQERINQFEMRTKELTDLHPDLREVQWEITELPYKEFEDFRSQYNARFGKDENLYLNIVPSNGRLFIIMGSHSNFYGKKMQVFLETLPVKTKTTVEVLEQP